MTFFITQQKNKVTPVFSHITDGKYRDLSKHFNKCPFSGRLSFIKETVIAKQS